MQPLADPVDLILLREAALLEESGVLAVLDDQSGALTLEALTSPEGEVRVCCDSLTAERAVATALTGRRQFRILPLGPDLLDGVRRVVLRLPKSLAALDEIAEAVARWADPSVQVLAGGRVKHMTRGMNDVLARHFEVVRASLGAQKSRVLIASGPRPAQAPRYPLTSYDPGLALTVCAHGAAFSGSTVDQGTRYLLGFADRFPTGAQRVVDLGCGTGVLAVGTARALPAAAVVATDDSWAAVQSAAATVAANDFADRVEVRRAQLLEGIATRSVDLVVCNPPFHRGNTRDSAIAFEMFEDAARALAPGGELWTVYNSHLPYLRSLRRLVGRTEVVGQNPGYTVTRSVVARA